MGLLVVPEPGCTPATARPVPPVTGRLSWRKIKIRDTGLRQVF